MESYGICSIIPPLLAIGLAYGTRQVIPALVFSIWVGATIIAGGNPIAGFGVMFRDHIVGSAADPWNVTILAACLMLGGMIGIIAGAGGMRAVAETLAEKAHTSRGGQLMTALLGLAVFFDDYANTLLIGSAMRPITDRLRISREKLSFLCDATAAPVASLSLISTWATYEMGILRGVFDTIGLDMNSYEALIRSLPYRFYSVFMLVFVFAAAWMSRDYGPMRRAESRARATGRVLADNATPLSGNELHDDVRSSITSHWLAAALPLVTVALIMIAGLVITGRASLMASDSDRAWSFRMVQDLIGNADGALSMLWAASCGALVAGICALSYRTLALSGVVDSWLKGAKSVLVAVIVLVLAWGIGQVCRDLGTARFIAGSMAGWMHPGFVPLASFVLGCLIAFTTGTAYGTVAILMPLAVPLAFTMSGSTPGPLVFATIGAIFTGAVFGDHCSPISDTTVMSSMACGADHIDHVRTQLPYALTVAVVALICGFIPAGFGLHPVISIATGGTLVCLVVRFVGKPSV